MELFNKLSEQDKKMIDYYISDYACTGHANLERLLRFWDSEKSQYLYKLLGNQFMVSRTFEYNQAESKLVDALNNKFNNYGTACWQFRREFDRFLWEMRQDLGQCYYKMQMLMDTKALINSKYEGPSFSVNCPEGKVVKIQTGCRPVRLISKVVKLYEPVYGELPHLVDFQNEVSIILTQKKLTGTMTLSIHPLDYMTMSDNECNWSSCMSWQDEGCYRRGTVEMMNSPMVVVAYLESDEKMYIRGGKWSNKKWRELFIVDRAIITGVKGYPYQNTDLVKGVNSWLKELAEKNLGWKYDDENIQYDHESNFIYRREGEAFDMKISFETETMYNDFGTITHYGILGSHVNEPIYLNYSGEAVCMSCGGINEYYGSEGNLVCDDCDESYYCEACGDRIEAGDEYELDGAYYCRYCYEDRAETDPLTDEEHDRVNMTKIYLIPSDADLNEIWKNDLLSDFPYFHTYVSNSSCRWKQYFYNDWSTYRKPGSYWATFSYVRPEDVKWGTFEEVFGEYPENWVSSEEDE